MKNIYVKGEFMKNIYAARLSKFKHKQFIQNKNNLKKMEELFGVNTKEDDILNLEDWKKSQRNNYIIVDTCDATTVVSYEINEN